MTVEVLDRGPGVPAAEREAIFESFRRGAGARGHGAGLGLATVRAAVEAHGGSVSVKHRPGGVAVFRVQLPASGGGTDNSRYALQVVVAQTNESSITMRSDGQGGHLGSGALPASTAAEADTELGELCLSWQLEPALRRVPDAL